MNIFNFFGHEKKSDLSEELKRIRLRNDARFRAVRERMQAEGKHMLSPSFKWTPSDKWAADRGIF